MISVVLPSNRCDGWLRDSIDSVLNSNCDFEFEVIVVLNNLNSEQKENIASFQSKYGEEVEFLQLGAGTLVDALNYGIEKSKFEFIARLDSDDTMTNIRLQRQLEFLLNNKDVALVGSAVNLINEYSEVTGYKTYPLHNSDIKSCLRFGNCFAHPSVMFRKNVFNLVGQYSNEFSYSEDFDLFTRICREHRVENLKERLTNYRIFGEQISSRFIHLQEASSLKIIQRESNLRAKERRIKFFLESGLLRARYRRARNMPFKSVILIVWVLLGIIFNFRNTLSYVRQFLLNSRFSSMI